MIFRGTVVMAMIGEKVFEIDRLYSVRAWRQERKFAGNLDVDDFL